MKRCLWVTAGLLLLANTVFAADEIEINKAAIEKSIPCYTANLKDLVIKAECRIKKIDARLTPADYRNAAEKRIKEGDALLAEGKSDDAVKAWQDALGLTKDPATQKMVEERALALSEERSKHEAEEQAALSPAAGTPETPEPAAAVSEPAPQKEAGALHESWYREEKKEKAPEPEQLGVGAIIDKRR